MLILYETPLGYALFKKDDNEKIALTKFTRFDDPLMASNSLLKLANYKLPKDLRTFLNDAVPTSSELLVEDIRLVKPIAEKLKIRVRADEDEAFRELRSALHSYLNVEEEELEAARRAVAHRLAAHKLKINSEKIDTMVIQAISLLEDLDKDINFHCMRLREWYGFHFPELSSILSDNLIYLRAVTVIRQKEKFTETKELEELVGEETAREIMRLREMSMGTELSGDDIQRIVENCESVIQSFGYREELSQYLGSRMRSIAPNLTALVGELVGARLLARAGSLVKLSKCAASTVQILGAEKALFNAIKNKTDTPKYGLLYHASLVGQSSQSFKGKISRMLAAKTSIAVRVDAFSDKTSNEIGVSSRKMLEEKLKQFESITENKKSVKKKSKHEFKSVEIYDDTKDYKRAKKN